MGEGTAIEWADHTFNPWWGCRRVSNACDHCYAATWAKRTGHTGLWDEGNYRTFSEKHWLAPLKWDKLAGERGVRERVFTASMADVFDVEAPRDERDRLWSLIRQTHHLDWLLLTKRANQALKSLPSDLSGQNHVWVGATAESGAMFRQRVRLLRKINTPFRFLSVEPLLENLDLRPDDLRGISWVIVGGETGRHARPMHPDWLRKIRDVCQAAQVAFFFKQWGDWTPVYGAGAGHVLVSNDTSDHAPNFMKKTGKKKAGRTLDGVTWNEVPSIPA